MRTINRFAAVFAAAGMAFALSGCGSGTGSDSGSAGADTGSWHDASADLDWITKRGSLIIGVTEFEPLDYQTAGEWEGFDAELAKQFAERLGVKTDFKVIDWDKKVDLLDSCAIDIIWNGMTMTAELEKKMTCSVPYLENSQVIVMKQEEFSRYTSAEECSHLLFACENGSAGQKLLEDMKYRSNGYGSQVEALEAVRDGGADAAAVDQIIAAHMTSSGGAFAGMRCGYPLNEELICAGTRINSDLAPELNAFLRDISADGTLRSTAEKYGLSGALAEIK